MPQAGFGLFILSREGRSDGLGAILCALPSGWLSRLGFSESESTETDEVEEVNEIEDV